MSEPIQPTNPFISRGDAKKQLAEFEVLVRKMTPQQRGEIYSYMLKLKRGGQSDNATKLKDA